MFQVKSYASEVKNSSIDNIVDRLEEAIKHYRAGGGFLITTGYSIPALEAATSKLENDMNTDIDIIADDDFACLVLRSMGMDLLF